MMKTSNLIRRGAAAVLIGGASVGTLGVMASPANAAPSLDAIKQCESGGDYGAVNPSSGASGAYQFLDSTWQSMNAAQGYATAADAPKHVQDAAAQELMQRDGASQWECSGMIASGAASAAPSVSAQSSSVQEEAPAPAPQAAPQQAPAQQQAPAEPAAPAPAPEPAAQPAPAVQQAPAVEYTAPVAQQPAPQATGSTYTVQAGDTLGSIAKKYGVSWQEIHQANGDVVADPNLIFPGQTLQIPA